MTRLTLNQALQHAVGHHQAGRFHEAEMIYRQILAQQPNHPDALQLLGAIAFQTGQFDVAIGLIRRAISLQPNIAAYHNNLGNALHSKGELDRAIVAYRQAARLKPNDPETQNNLGNALRDKGLLDESIAACRQALRIKPDYAEAYNNLGNALHDKGIFDEAIASFQKAIGLRPDFAEAYSNLGNALREKGQIDDAIAACRRAIELQPDLAAAHNNLGNAMLEKKLIDESISACRQALSLNPNYGEAYNNLGSARFDKGQLDEAIADFRKAIELKPDSAEAHSNLGNALREKGQIDDAIAACNEAVRFKPDNAGAHNNLANAYCDKGQLDQTIAAYQQAIQLQPEYAEAHHNLGMAYLLTGNFKQGWPECEWRWRNTNFAWHPRNFLRPQWKGQDLTGRTILLFVEQGFGDNIQFARYVPLVAQRGGQVILACQPEMKRLLAGMTGIEQLICPGENIPPFDFHCPLLSLPLAFDTELASIPREVPYLSATIADAEKWREKLGSSQGKLRIGLVWAGSREPGNGRHRSMSMNNRAMSLSQLALLANIPAVDFYSLQKDKRLVENSTLRLIDYTAELNDFADTAGLIAHLDLVITVDTAVAHLAGAMGKNVWTMLQFAADWRWLLQRDDSPWYPTMRLFRQNKPGDWTDVIDRMARLLVEMAAKRF